MAANPDRPFVLLAQPSLFDATRAPDGSHTAWTYCHVPNGSTADMLPRIERQIERFAPGFRDRVLARHVMTPADFERRNPNLVGGDIGMGVMNVRQTHRASDLLLVPDAEARPVSLFGLHAAWRRRTRNVRLLRGAVRPE